MKKSKQIIAGTEYVDNLSKVKDFQNGKIKIIWFSCYKSCYKGQIQIMSFKIQFRPDV